MANNPLIEIHEKKWEECNDREKQYKCMETILCALLTCYAISMGLINETRDQSKAN